MKQIGINYSQNTISFININIIYKSLHPLIPWTINVYGSLMFKNRSALVESKLRHLVLKLEVIEDLESAHPFIKGYDKTVVCYSEQQAIDAGIEFIKNR